MAQGDGTVKLYTSLDKSGAERGIKSLSGSFSKLGGIIAAAFSVAAIIQFSKVSLKAASDLESAMIGLKSIMDGQGRSFQTANKFVQEYIQDGLIPATEAITAYKNLALRGYSTEQIEKTLVALKDSAAFARQGSLTMGQAVRGASEGLKNENSLLVDNAGVTKNVAKMWEEYAKRIGITTKSLTQQQKIQAEVEGILEETKFQMGDAAKVAGTYQGQVTSLSFAFNNMKIAFGNFLKPIVQFFIPIIKEAVLWLTRLFNLLAQVSAVLFGTAKSLTGQASQQQAIADTGNAAAGAQTDLADATKKAGKSAKNSLASFDKLNKLQEKSADSGAGATESAAPDLGGADLGEIIVGDIDPKILDWIDNVKTRFAEVADFIKSLWDNIWTGLKAGLDKIDFSAILENLKIIFDGIGEIFENGINNLKLIAQAAATLIGTIFEWVLAIGGKVFEILAQSFAQFIADNKERIIQWQNDIATSIVQIFENIGKVISGIGQIILDALEEKRDQIASTLSGFFATINDVIMLAISVIVDVFEIITKVIAQWVENNKEKIRKFVENIIDLFTGVGDTINKIVQDFLKILKDNWDKYFKGFVQSVASAAMDIYGWFLDLYNIFIAPIISRMLEWVNRIWEDSLKGIVDEVLGFVGRIGELFGILWEQKVKPIVDFFMTYMLPMIKEVFTIVVDFIGATVNNIGIVIEMLLGIFNGLLDFLMGVFTGDWGKAWSGVQKILESVFEGIQKFIKNSVNGIIDVINGMIRGVTAGINGLIGLLNSLDFELPDWLPGDLGGKRFGLHIPTVSAPQIPRLATGTVVPPGKPFLAELGDNTREHEVVSPLSTIKQAIREEMQASGSSGNITINATGDVAQLIRFLKFEIEQEGRTRGPKLSNRVIPV